MALREDVRLAADQHAAGAVLEMLRLPGGATMTAPIRPAEHGTLTGYAKGCHDPACCGRAHTEHLAQWRRDRAYGRQRPGDRMPLEPSRCLVLELVERGYTDPQISRLTGLASAQVSRIRRGTLGYVSRETADRVAHGHQLALSVPPVDRIGARYVPALGARRRIRALMAMGWDMRTLIEEHGVGTLSPILYSDRDITPRVHADVAALYRRLGDTLGPSKPSRTRARNKGWLTPAELDDDRLDDPTYDPVLEREITRAELEAQERAHRLLEVHRLTASGHSASEISRRLGMTDRTIVRYRAAWQEAS